MKHFKSLDEYKEHVLHPSEHLTRAAETVRARAAALAPVETGRLRASLAVKSEGDRVILSCDCPYAAAVELGTSKRAATPFLLPAAREYGGEA